MSFEDSLFQLFQGFHGFFDRYVLVDAVNIVYRFHTLGNNSTSNFRTG